MDALRPDFARDRLGEDALRRLGRREACEIRLAAERRGIPAGDDRTLSCGYHGWCKTTSKVQQRHGIDLEIAVHDLRVDVQEIAESAADGIVDEHRGHAQRLCRRRNYGVELCFVGHVTDKGFGIFDLVFECGETLAIAGEHRDGVTACREPAGDCRASSWPHSRHKGDWAPGVFGGHVPKPFFKWHEQGFVSFQPLHGTRQELLSFPIRRPEGHPRKMAVRHVWRKAVSPAGHVGPCGPGSAELSEFVCPRQYRCADRCS